MSDRLYFTTEHDGVLVDQMGSVLGLTRLDGENDGQFRERLQLALRSVRHGTREDIIQSVEALRGVSRCRVTEEHTDAAHVRVVVEATLESWCRGAYEDELRNELHATLQSIIALGVHWVLEIEHEPATFGPHDWDE